MQAINTKQNSLTPFHDTVIVLHVESDNWQPSVTKLTNVGHTLGYERHNYAGHVMINEYVHVAVTWHGDIMCCQLVNWASVSEKKMMLQSTSEHVFVVFFYYSSTLLERAVSTVEPLAIVSGTWL